MAKYHHTHREQGWRQKLVDQRVRRRGLGARRADLRRREVHRGRVGRPGRLPGAVVRHDAAEPAVPPRGACAGPGHHRSRAATARALPHYPRHVVLVAVDRLDLAVLRAMRYAGSLRPDRDPRGPHHARQRGRRTGWNGPGSSAASVTGCRWRSSSARTGGLSGRRPSSRCARSSRTTPRSPCCCPGARSRRLSSRLLHDRTADRIAEAVGRIPHVAATIVPFDTTLDTAVEDRMEAQQERGPALPPARARPRRARRGARGRAGHAAAGRRRQRRSGR